MRDLTQGGILKTILLFTFPILIANLFQQFYTIVDTVIVGNVLGIRELAAMGATSSLSFLVVGFVTGMTNGFSIVVARDYGSGDRSAMKKSIAGTLLLGCLVAVLMTVVSLLLLDPILRLIQTPADIFDDAKGYIEVIFAGMLVTMLYNVAASVLRAVGDSRTPLYFLVVAALLNIVLDLVFLKNLGFGVEGAAYATILSQGVSVVLSYGYIFWKCQNIIPAGGDFRLGKERTKELLAQGFSMGLQSAFVAVGSVAIQSAVNGLDTVVVAAHTAARKLDEMMMIPMITLGTASATFAGQNIGAGRVDRVRKGFAQCMLVCVAWSVLSVVGVLFFADEAVGLLVNHSDPAAGEVIAIASRYLQFNFLFFFALGAVFLYRDILQGMGSSLAPVASSFIELFVKIITVLFLTPHIGYNGVIVCEPIAWVLCTILLAVVFRKESRQRLVE